VGIKSLAKDTAIYGMSSIIGRFLNWCLVPLYTHMFSAEQYGVVTFVYSVVALVLIALTYGMETGFFRFANHDRWRDPMQVYSTVLISLATSGAFFIAAVALALNPLTSMMRCDGHPSWVMIMAVCVAVDAFSAIPFSYLRFRNRAMRFAVLKLVNIGLNIGLNLFFILLCPWLMKVAPSTVDWFYRPDFSIGYIFLANGISSVVTLAMLLPEMRGFRWRFCGKLFRNMLAYSLPLLVLGLAGIMNQTIDKIIFPVLYKEPDVMDQLGIYGANYKIAIVMVMFIQAFRFAYEPFIFAQNKQDGRTSTAAYSQAMKYFVIFALFIFLGVMFYLDILKYFIAPKFFSGLAVVPIVMLAELFFGIFFNLSVWYKLTDKTIWGAWFSLLGLAVTLAMNAFLVPSMGYMGCAWAALTCYTVMMAASYLIGRRRYPIAYHLRRLGFYAALAAVLYAVGIYIVDTRWEIVNFAIRAVLLAVYCVAVAKTEHISGAELLRPLLAKIGRR